MGAEAERWTGQRRRQTDKEINKEQTRRNVETRKRQRNVETKKVKTKKGRKDIRVISGKCKTKSQGGSDIHKRSKKAEGPRNTIKITGKHGCWGWVIRVIKKRGRSPAQRRHHLP